MTYATYMTIMTTQNILKFWSLGFSINIFAIIGNLLYLFLNRHNGQKFDYFNWIDSWCSNLHKNLLFMIRSWMNHFLISLFSIFLSNFVNIVFILVINLQFSNSKSKFLTLPTPVYIWLPVISFIFVKIEKSYPSMLWVVKHIYLW